MSIVSAFSVSKALDKNKYEVVLLGIDKSGRWLLPEQSRLTLEGPQSKDPWKYSLSGHNETVAFVPYEGDSAVVAVGKNSPQAALLGPVDVVLPILHGTYGEDGTVQGLLELANVPFVGAGVLGSAIGMDKDVAKRLLAAGGIPVVPWLTVRRSEFETNPGVVLDAAESKFGYPYFVKPANMGSSVGVHKVKSRKTAQADLKDTFQYDTKTLIEKAIPARELEVSVLGNAEPRASVVGEIIPSHEFYSYEAKYVDQHGADLMIPAPGLSDAQTKTIQTYATRAFQAIECRGMARVDFFMDKTTGEIYLNELNTIPGFTSISMYPKLWEATGLKYADLLDELIRLALESHMERSSLKTAYAPK